MATAKTDLEKATDKQSSLVAEIEKLRQQAEEEERKLIEKQQVESVQVNVDLLEIEKAKLQARLEAAKEATKAFAEQQTPIEQAEAARAEAQAAVTSDEKDGE